LILLWNLDGLISYSIPQGDRRGYNTQFFDEIYDGKNENGTLKDGLGQLTDGIIGQNDYYLTDNIQIGYDWIGWKKRSNVNLIFYFDTIRNFTSIRIHTSNFFTHDIYLFHSIRIKNCENLNNYQRNFLVPNDYINTTSRFIQISLADNNNILSNCLNITLDFNNRSKWILISEIQFDSIPINLLILKDISIIHYWHWLFFSFILLIILLIFIYIHLFQIYDQHNK
jgi:discoidin domain receptor family protein 2